MKLYFWTCIVSFLASLPLCSQIKIGNNPERISQASVLELESNHRVLVITRVTTQEMEQITPLEGALAFNTDTGCIHYFDGTFWKNLCATPAA
jgi:trimeric autotransporter adhesin